MKRGVRLIDIAAVAGVSKVTVSKVLNPGSCGNHTRVSDATAERIRTVAAELGYRPNLAARQLAGGWSRLIGVLIDAASSPGELLRTSYAEEVAAAHGYRFLVGQYRADLRNILAQLDDFAARGADGVILHANAFPDWSPEIVSAARKLRHAIYYDRPTADDGTLDYVEVDFADGTRQVVEHLWQRGRRRIVYFPIYTRPLHGKWPVRIARETGFREAMARHGCTIPENFADVRLFEHAPTIAEQLAFAKEFLAEHRPDAVVAANDEAAAVMLRALRELKIHCPEEVAVAGYDNLRLCEFVYPTLTTVDNRLPEVSRLIVESLIARIEGKILREQPVRLTCKPTLMIRETT